MEKQREMEIVKQAFVLLDKEDLTDAMVDEAFGLLGKVFDGDCLKQIQKGFEDGLTPERVSLYAKPEFTCDQMEEKRVDFIAEKEASVSVKKLSLAEKIMAAKKEQGQAVSKGPEKSRGNEELAK